MSGPYIITQPKLCVSGIWRAVVKHPGLPALHMGIVSFEKITKAFAEYLADGGSIVDFLYIGSGTDATAESNDDTTLRAEVETRVLGQASNPSIYVVRITGTQTYTSSRSINEVGCFTASSGGTLCDRGVVGPFPVVSGTTISWAFDATVGYEN